MADVISAATGAGGLGTRPARWVFVFVWSCGVWFGVFTDLTPLDPLNASAYLAGLAGGVLLTTPGAAPLTRRRVTALVVLALYVAVIALHRSPVVANVPALTFATYLVAFVIPRGNIVAGAVGGSLVIGYALGWGLTADPSGAGLVFLLGVPVGSVAAGMVWRLALRWIVRRERAHRDAGALAADRAAAADEAIDASRREFADIRAEVGPLLARIGAGESIDEAMRTQLAVVEAAIRDRIRAPHLQHPLLVEELARLRARGVAVVVLGEPPAGDPVIPAAVALRIVELISPTTEGRITVRSLPAGRAAAMSVVVQTGNTSEQVHLAPDGRVLSRS